jgi:hypothetical protein
MSKLALTPGRISEGEHSLRVALQRLLPHYVPAYNYKQEAGLFHPTTGYNMELDVFYSEIRLAFEYQGRQHFHQSANYSGQQTRRDQEKQAACQSHNITLIQVPYWWDNSIDSLAATIHMARPDVILSVAVDASVAPIPTTEPSFGKERKFVDADPAGYFIKVKKYDDSWNPVHR